jgi:hypothetical protein
VRDGEAGYDGRGSHSHGGRGAVEEQLNRFWIVHGKKCRGMDYRSFIEDRAQIESVDRFERTTGGEWSGTAENCALSIFNPAQFKHQEPLRNKRATLGEIYCS